MPVDEGDEEEEVEDEEENGIIDDDLLVRGDEVITQLNALVGAEDAFAGDWLEDFMGSTPLHDQSWSYLEEEV